MCEYVCACARVHALLCNSIYLDFIFVSDVVHWLISQDSDANALYRNQCQHMMPKSKGYVTCYKTYSDLNLNKYM